MKIPEFWRRQGHDDSPPFERVGSSGRVSEPDRHELEGTRTAGLRHAIERQWEYA